MWTGHAKPNVQRMNIDKLSEDDYCAMSASGWYRHAIANGFKPQSLDRSMDFECTIHRSNLANN
jgi:hypothetical protein